MASNFKSRISNFESKTTHTSGHLTVIRNSPFVIFFAILVTSLFLARAQEELPRQEDKFTLGRIFFDVPMRMMRRGMGPIGSNYGPPWSHDWPRSEEHFMKILSEVTKLDVNPGGHITSFQTDDCFKYPIAYLCEVGSLNLSEEEVGRMAEYLIRGGFLIVDDFRGERDLYNFRRQMQLVFPDRTLEELPPTHKIWTCFYDISDLQLIPPYDQFYEPQYFGMSDDNGRLMMVVNYNTDISEYWEWSNDPWMPIDDTNEAYKYGVNYVIYALTH